MNQSSYQRELSPVKPVPIYDVSKIKLNQANPTSYNQWMMQIKETAAIEGVSNVFNENIITDTNHYIDTMAKLFIGRVEKIQQEELRLIVESHVGFDFATETAENRTEQLEQ